MEKKITLTIGKDGKITADAEGFQGKQCLEATTDRLLDGLAVQEKQELRERVLRRRRSRQWTSTSGKPGEAASSELRHKCSQGVRS